MERGEVRKVRKQMEVRSSVLGIGNEFSPLSFSCSMLPFML